MARMDRYCSTRLDDGSHAAEQLKKAESKVDPSRSVHDPPTMIRLKPERMYMSSPLGRAISSSCFDANANTVKKGCFLVNATYCIRTPGPRGGQPRPSKVLVTCKSLISPL